MRFDFLFKKNKNKRCFYSLVSPCILIQSCSIELVCVDIWSFNNNKKSCQKGFIDKWTVVHFMFAEKSSFKIIWLGFKPLLFHYLCLYLSFTGIDIDAYVTIYLHPYHLYPCYACTYTYFTLISTFISLRGCYPWSFSSASARIINLTIRKPKQQSFKLTQIFSMFSSNTT